MIRKVYRQVRLEGTLENWRVSGEHSLLGVPKFLQKLKDVRCGLYKTCTSEYKSG